MGGLGEEEEEEERGQKLVTPIIKDFGGGKE